MTGRLSDFVRGSVLEARAAFSLGAANFASLGWYRHPRRQGARTRLGLQSTQTQRDNGYYKKKFTSLHPYQSTKVNAGSEGGRIE